MGSKGVLESVLEMAPNTPLHEWIKSFPRARVLCVGDIIIDHFVSGTVSRISKEVPVPVLRFEERKSVLGGVGNVLRSLAHLGVVQSYLVTVVGDDNGSCIMESLLQQIPGNHFSQQRITLIKDPSRSTTELTRYMSGKQHFLRLDQDTTTSLSNQFEQAVLEAVFKYFPLIDAIVLSDYQRGVLTPEVVESIITRARLEGKQVLVDPTGEKCYEKYNGADILKPNRFELSGITGNMPVATDREIIEASYKVKTIVPQVNWFLVTRDKDGMSLVDPSADLHLWQPSQAMEIVDVVGAGDTVSATMAICLSIGVPLRQAMLLASIAAGIVVGKYGTATVTQYEMEEHIQIKMYKPVQVAATPKVKSKIVSLESAKEIVAKWRREEKACSIGFTNGYFNALRKAHLSVLSEGKKICSRLIVALHGDFSVQRMKGLDKSFQNEEDRAAVLEALEIVDIVIIFQQESPLQLILELRPDVLVKCGENGMEQI